LHYRILHLSDLHTGWHFDLRVAEDLARQAHEIHPDLVVISGDFVLRADFTSQWTAVVAYLKMLPQPQLRIPGNHDVSLLNGFYRLFSPLKRYCYYISDNLNPVFTLPGLSVVGGCTAHGLTLDGGRLYPGQVRRLEEKLTQFGAETCTVMVLHHHVVDPPHTQPRRKIANAHTALNLMHTHRVDLFLCGHTHASYVGTTRGLLPNTTHETIISQCGTSTSRRGRGQDRGKNSFHLITINNEGISIVPHFYEAAAKKFLPAKEHQFPRCWQQPEIGTSPSTSPTAHLAQETTEP